MKKYIHQLLTITFVILVFASCKKENNNQPLASINVIHATVAVPTVKINYFETTINYAVFTSGPGALAFGANTVVSVSPGNSQVTVVPSADTLHPIYSSSVTTEAGKVYSLYLAGQSTAPEAVLVTDKIPYYNSAGKNAGDSVFGVRFINLSYNSTPVNVTLSTSTTTNEFSSITYKTGTEFKTYPAQVANSGYTFQVRDASNTILASFSFTAYSSTVAATAIPRFFNCTLALIGQIGGTGANAPKLIRINNY